MPGYGLSLYFLVQSLMLNINSIVCNDVCCFLQIMSFDKCCLIVLKPIHLGLHHQCKLAYVFRRDVLVARACACFRPQFCFGMFLFLSFLFFSNSVLRVCLFIKYATCFYNSHMDALVLRGRRP